MISVTGAVRRTLRLLGLQVSRAQSPADRAAAEVRKFQWLKRHDFQTILDVGANEGQFAEQILTVFPKAELHSFEPVRSAFAKLQEKFRHRRNVTLHHFGLGETDEEREIFRNEYSPSSSLLPMLDLHKSNFTYAVQVEPEVISIRRLDGVFEQPLPKPVLVKIDVQGYEMFVIRGGETIIDQADAVIVEVSFYPLYEGQPLFDDIYRYFVGRGFHYRGNVEQLLAPTDKRILQADAVFIRPHS